MISRRNRRPGRPQENIRQFALNNSKGVDSTKSPTDFNTISAAKNLIVNADGSVSLRKPITVLEHTVSDLGYRQYYLYDGVHKLIVYENTFYIEDAFNNWVDIELRYTTYKGVVQTLDRPKAWEIADIIFPQKELALINLNSTTILGNCSVDVSTLPNIVDTSLYDTVSKLPRYIQIYYAENNGIWVLEIKQPEPNTLTAADGEIALNLNMTLDNPTTLRDVYDATLPSVKGILAYVPSKVVNGEILPADALYSRNPSPTINEVYFDGDPLTKHTDVQIGELVSYTIGETLTIVPSRVSRDGVQFKVPLEVSLKMDGTSPVTHKVVVEYSCTVTAELKDTRDSTVMYTHTQLTPQVYTGVYTSDALREGVKLQVPCSGTHVVPEYCTVLHGYSRISAHAKVTYYTEGSEAQALRVKDITESAQRNRFRIATLLKKGTDAAVVLKAFCKIPTAPTAQYYAAWFYSSDGINWSPLQDTPVDSISVKELLETWNPESDVDKTPDATKDYVTHRYSPFDAVDEDDPSLDLRYDNASGYSWTSVRPDVACINTPGSVLKSFQYRFKVIAVEPLEEGDPEYIEGDEGKYRVYATIAQQDYTPVFKNEFEFFDVDFGNAVYGKKFYNKKSIYSYGSEKFLNNIFVSDIDSFITPLYNIIDLDTYEASQATCIVPWRDYLVSATENAIYLHSRQSEGFLTKTVNTSIGIPEEDSRCCKSILNGILFKSGPKIYQMYPNMYSGDDSTLNLTEISKPVEDYLEDYTAGEHTPFALSTESEYILMLPRESSTLCLRYDYSSKLWAVCTYPIVAQYYEMLNLNDIRIFGTTSEFFAEFKFDSESSGTVYGDSIPGHTEIEVVPIEFEWDTGQKTDNISIAKQFVESKLIFATEDDLEYFPMELTVHIDGDPHVTTLDVSSDAPFWKNGDSKGVANTAFRLGDTADTGVFRQLIVRYSGKGRSIRHILSGRPTSNFRLYEAYIRYKTLNIKR